VAAFREMGVTIVGPENGELTIYGVGKNGLRAPRKPLYMGNSGTAMRLLAGLLAAQSFDSELTGDESLMERPMNRVAVPLRSMGANIDTGDSGTPPLKIRGSKLKGITYEMPIASAQIKSCLLLAGLYATGDTRIFEPTPCRDHTERMLQGFGYSVSVDAKEGASAVVGGADLQATEIDVPADISSAAFFLVAAAITPGSDLTLHHVGVNPTRIGIINLLRDMGANIERSNERLVGGEPVADLRVRYKPLKGIVISEAQIPLAIDEFPVLFIAAACAEGDTLLHGAEELRVKESDRLDAMAQGLEKLGVTVETFDDGIKITGGPMGGATVDSFGDHRIAMAFTVAGLRAESPIDIANCANVATSFPNFVELAIKVGMRVSAIK
jgi:3-phosphoshikimate 1-carboxyvinyltransferase